MGTGQDTLRQQIRERTFRAHVLRFETLEFQGGLHSGGHGHEAIKTTRIECAILVLAMVIHGSSFERRIF